MFVAGKLLKPSLTNTSLLRKFVNYGQKSFITLGPDRRTWSLSIQWYNAENLGASAIKLFTAIIDCKVFDIASLV